MIGHGYRSPGGARLRAAAALLLAAAAGATGTRAAPLDATCRAYVAQSSNADTTNVAVRAVDGTNSTYSLTADLPGSFWTVGLIRRYAISRIELVNRAAPYAAEMAGLTARLYDLDDQVVWQTTLTNPGAGATWSVDFPTPVGARSLWIGLEGGATNGGGNRRVGLAEVRLHGDTSIPFGPGPLVGITAVQSSDYSASYPASNALDGNTNTFTHTQNLTNSYWFADLDSPCALDRIELVNRVDTAANRMQGLILRIMDAASNTVVSATVTNPGLGGTWRLDPPAGTTGRYVRVGLENGLTNGGGNFFVTLAEARFFTGTNQIPVQAVPVPPTGTVNLAAGRLSYMTRLTPTLAPAWNANDDVYATEAKTTTATVDGYWEVDLGGTYAVYGTRTIGASGIGNRLTNTTLRLFDEAHESVCERRVTGIADVFDTDAGGPYFARYVRIGLEDKRRTSPTGGTEWYIGMREVEVFGRPTNGIGIVSFGATTSRIARGQTVGLNWTVEDVSRVELHPGVGSVGALTTGASGSTTLAPTTSVEYLLVATNPARRFARGTAVLVGTDPLPPRISEFVADNRYSLEDGHGEAPDWIEVRNPGNAAVNLAGWGLSDDPGQPYRWVFPSTNLAAHGTLVVFASGRETSPDPAGRLHANFRLDAAGGSLVLTDPEGATADAFIAYPAQDTDLAYGRDLAGRAGFLDPTPGDVNAPQAYEGWLRPVAFSRARGVYDTPFTLTITNDNPGSTVYWSADGTVPTNVYGGGIAVASTRSVRVLVARPGWHSPRIQTQSYLFPDSVIASPEMSTTITQDPRFAPRMRPGLLALPSFFLALPGEPGYDEKEGSVEILWPDATPPVQANCGISRFGNSYTSFTKKSFRLKFRDTYGVRKLQAPLFGGFDRGTMAVTSFDELDLRSGSHDMSQRGFYMSGRFVEDSMLEMGSLNPHGRYAHVYLNGVYWGQYDLRELMVDRFLADYLGGASEDYVNVRGNDNVGSAFVLGAPDPPNLLPWERVVALGGSYASVRPYLDVPNLVDFMLLWFYGNCEAEYRAAGPLAAGSGFKFWMADADGFLRTNAVGMNTTANTGPAGLFGALTGEGDADFKTLLADRIYRHFFNDGALTPARTDARLAARMGEVHDSLLAECARWPAFRTPDSWEAASTLVRQKLFPVRTTQLVAMVRARGFYPSWDPPAFNVYGGIVSNGFLPTVSAPSGTVYFTTDGSDPRLSGGGISPTAKVWAPGGVSVTQDVAIAARVRLPDGRWSALAQPRFLVGGRAAPTSDDLLVSEIHYNPAGGDDLEFIEFHNAGTNLLDLSGCFLTNGVRFIFPPGFAVEPGGFAVVAESTNAFAARYGDPASPCYWPGIAVAGEWAGSLANEGEILTVADSNGVELVSIDYGTSGDWPERADGDGSSLELRALPPAGLDPAARHAWVNGGRNWTSSSLYDGSPGRFDGFVRAVRINEALTHTDAETDWIELQNRSGEPVDVSGLWLTDHLGLPRRFQVPPDTVLPPGAFLSFGAAELGFAFSELGGEAALLQVSGTNILRFVDTVDFPAAAREEPFGLFERSDGELDFTELRSGTRLGANALPRVGPLVFGEIHFAPTNGLAEFVELCSVTNAAVALYDPAWPTNTWRIEGVGDYVFPTGTVVGSRGTLIVCSTSPAVFRAQYGVDPAVPVFGPWGGALDDDGETLKLLRPGAPEPDGTVPYYRVDRVAYRTVAPWPAAGAGRSIEKVTLEAYGNDPVYWRAGDVAGVSPGAPRPNRPPQVIGPAWVEIPETESSTVGVSIVELDAPWQTARLLEADLPAGAAYDAGAGRLTWAPDELAGPGVYTARFVAVDSADGAAASSTGEVAIAVAEVNLPPWWAWQRDVTWPLGGGLELHPAAGDPDLPAQALSFRAEGLPALLDIDAASGRVTGTCAQAGSHPVSLYVSDAQSPPLEATNRFMIRVPEPLSLDAVAPAPGAARISFATATGETYVVEATPRLDADDWQPVAVFSNVPGDAVVWPVPVDGTATSRFFRVRWPLRADP